MDSDDDSSDPITYHHHHHHRHQIGPKLISLQSDFNLASPFLSVMSLASSNFLFRRVMVGLLAAAYVFFVLMLTMVAAGVVGVGLVRMWTEEPLSVRENLQLDYRYAHPTAVFSLGKMGGIPVGQTLYVSLHLVMPESYFNEGVGIFQLSAELATIEGEVIAEASRPCMLGFRSLPLRLMRTFAMGVPLMLGIAAETQSLVIPVLKHKEKYFPRANQVRINIVPRAGTSAVPQFYSTELVITSSLPWRKDFVHRWRWTIYVWTSLYVFIALVTILVRFLKPLILPNLAASRLPKVNNRGSMSMDLAQQETTVVRKTEEGEGEVSESSLRRWQRSRNKRKAALLRDPMVERADDSSASSITWGGFEEGSGDSESCIEG